MIFPGDAYNATTLQSESVITTGDARRRRTIHFLSGTIKKIRSMLARQFVGDDFAPDGALSAELQRLTPEQPTISRWPMSTEAL